MGGRRGGGGGRTLVDSDYIQGKRSGPSPTYLQLFPLPNLESEVFICLFVCFVSAFSLLLRRDP